MMTALGVLASGGAFAADVAIKGNVSETLQASDNYFLNTKPLGATVNSTTAGTLNFFAGMEDTKYFLDTNYSYYQYFGPGAAQTFPEWGAPASATFRMNHVT